MTRKPTALTSADMVLVAMYRASGGSVSKVPYEEIVIKAWEGFPKVFSLRNHPEHPDASDVHKRLYQTLVPKGLAVSLGSKIFRLTDQGVERAKGLAEGAREIVEGNRASRSGELILRHVKGSRAYATWANGSCDDLVDYDVRLFFQFGAGTDRDERRRRADAVIMILESAVKAGDPEAPKLLDLAHHLRSKFSTLF